MHVLNLVPLVRLLFPLVIGIFSAFLLPIDNPFIFYFIAVLLILLIATYIFKPFKNNYALEPIFGILLHLFLFLAGFELAKLNSVNFSAPELEIIAKSRQKNTLVIATIVDSPQRKIKSIKVIAEISAICIDNEWFSFSKKAMLFIGHRQGINSITYGDKLLLRTNLNIIPTAQNPGEFNYKNYLLYRQVALQAFVSEKNYLLLEQNTGNIILRFANECRSKLVAILEQSGLTNQELAVASALIIGERTQLDSNLIQAYSASGATHILSVSGLHVGIVYLVLHQLLLILFRFKSAKIINSVIIITVLWFYALLTGLSPSVLRAATMFSFIVLGQTFKRNTNIYNTLAASAILLLVINPSLIMDVGFQLSYLAVLGIVFLYPKFYDLWIPANYLLDKIWSITCVSMAAQIATLPLTCYYFHQFPNYFLLSNLLVIPISTGIIYLGILTMLFSAVPCVFYLLGFLLKQTVIILNNIVLLIEKLPFSTLKDIYINEFQLVVFFLFVLFVIIYFIRLKVKYCFLSLLALLIFVVVLSFKNYQKNLSEKFIVFNINKISAYEFKLGNKGFIMADSSFFSNTLSQKFHTQAYRAQLGVNSELAILLDKKNQFFPDFSNIKRGNFFYKANFIQANNKRILIITPANLKMIKKLKYSSLYLDYLIISGDVKVKLKDLFKYFKISAFIIDSSNSKLKSDAWMKEAQELSIRCFDVKKTGALEFQL